MSTIKKLSVLAIGLMFFLTGCGMCKHTSVSEATCTESAVCDLCGQTFAGPIGHSTNSGYCYRCNEYVNCLKLNDQMVDAIGKKCNDSALAATLASDKIIADTGIEFKPETAKLSVGYQENDYLYHIEFSIEAENYDEPLLVKRNYYVVENADEATGWQIGYHDEK